MRRAILAAATLAMLVGILILMRSGQGGGGNKSAYTLGEIAPPKIPSPAEVHAHPVEPALEQELPLRPGDLVNQEALDLLDLPPEQGEALMRRGFVLKRWGYYDDFSEAYEAIAAMGLPIYVTADTVLHTYHVLFDTILAQIEEERIYPDLVDLSRAMVDESMKLYESAEGEVREAARRNAAFFSVALKLLDPSFKPPGAVAGHVEAEIRLIESHSGVQRSPTFGYEEDYSQYTPRGHYTRSEKLQRYFKAMMWYGRMAFLLRGGPEGFVSEEEARRLTLQASLISALMPGVELEDGRTAGEVWSSIYSITSFFVGFADDLTPYDYLEALRAVFGGSVSPTEILEKIDYLRAELAKRGRPRIYGGTGACVVYPPFTEEDLAECLDRSAGMRFMGQRYVPDSYVFQRLTTPSVGLYTGGGEPFTLGHTLGGPARVFPRGLDWFAVVGSDRALEIIRSGGDADYERYEEVLAELRAEFSNLTQEDWSRNLYWSWLDALRILVRPRPEGYPAYMRTEAWEDRQLMLALASWAELRHDTILYAKQSYTPVLGALPPQPMAPKAFVEPLPDLYARLMALVRQTEEGLRSMGYLTEDAEARLKATASLLSKLIELSNKELSGEPLSEEDVRYILGIGDTLDGLLEGISDRSKTTVVVADVHTDLNLGLVLEEGVGRLDLIVVVFPSPAGNYVAAGPVLTYYEFKHPMSDRLTDEAWEALLNESPPERQPWILELYALGGGV